MMRFKVKSKATFNWFFQNRQTGEITIAQKPNLILSLTVAAFLTRSILEFLDSPSLAVSIAHWVSSLLLILFGLDELFRGVNPWRRTIGVVACFLSGISIYNL